jgi:acyl-CoA-dependent ceramide synthase
MEQAQAGSGLVDLPTPHTIPHDNGSNETTSNGSAPEKMSAYSPPQQTIPIKRTRNTKSNRGGVEDIALCASPAGFLTTKSRGQAEKESIGGMLRKAMVNHQLGISLNLILLVTLTYILFPSLRERVGSFFTLQYPTGKVGEFSIGPRDVYLVAGYVVLFTGLRAALMDYLLLPLAGLMGIRSKKLRVR